MYLCNAVTGVTSLATTPPTVGARAFPLNNCPIYVPAESVEAYQTATSWVNQGFASRVVAIPE